LLDRYRPSGARIVERHAAVERRVPSVRPRSGASSVPWLPIALVGAGAVGGVVFLAVTRRRAGLSAPN
jgi:hypothetical protein